MDELSIQAGGVTLAGEEEGEGVPVVLLHGLTATRRYVVMGSKALPRSGHRVVSYDARGHGASTPPADRGAYGYELLAADLLAVLDDRGLERAVFAGASMGAHTIARVALEQPDRVAGAVFVTPAYDGELDDPRGWDRLADGLERGGIEGFVEAYDLGRMPEAWHETVLTVLRQRLSHHRHLDPVADALRAVPRSRPFGALSDLGDLACPAVVVADRDEADPGHPLATGEAWATALPDAELVVEEPGRSPIAWQGGQLSKVIAGLAARVAV
jgi:pimeloyl-ACP methyl ester carboxylesterase